MNDEILTLENLNSEISNWKFGGDFHNKLYSDLYSERNNAFSQAHWNYLIVRLTEWAATRPKRKNDIYIKCLEMNNEMKKCFNYILSKQNCSEPDILTINWDEINCLFKNALSIKETKNNSPVFASKLCHFLLPKVFFISDNLFVSRFDYPKFWQESKEFWVNCPNKNELINKLKNRIGPNLIENYPFATKITDLCYMGSYF